MPIKPQPGPPYLGPSHRFVAVVFDVPRGRFSNLAAAVETARILSGSNTTGWYIEDAVSGAVWPPESLRGRLAG